MKFKNIYLDLTSAVERRCREHCSSLRYAYYALIWGYQCSCGNDPPDVEYKKDEPYCYRTCPGDPSEMCGGSDNRVNIYKIEGGSSFSTTPLPSPVPIINMYL